MGKLAKVTEVTSAKSIDEVLKQSGTDWDVKVCKMGAAGCHGKEGPEWDNGGYRALVRPDTNTALAAVGERFRVNNHRQQLHTLDMLVENGDLIPHSVSMWDNGALLAYQFRCPNLDVSVNDVTMVSPLFTLAYAYGSQLADSAFFADFNWRCKNQNGQVAKLNSDSRVKHRGAIVERYREVVLCRLQELRGELSDRYKAMASLTTKQLTGKALVSYIGECVGASELEVEMAYVSPPEELKGKGSQIAQVLECYQVDDCGAEGSIWQAYNAVTRYETHHHGRTEASRMRSMLFDTGGRVANNAWDLAVRVAA